jgi:2-keto-3-deoxy-6-phosphogluconate aldolase
MSAIDILSDLALDLASVVQAGVNLNAAAKFLEAGAAALGIGGELVHPHALKSGNRNAIVENVRKFLAIVLETRAKLGSHAVPAGI